MKTLKKNFIFAFVSILLILAASALVAQEPYSTLNGTVIGVHKRLLLEVESEKDKAIVNFRIGRNTRYTPHRYPNPGEKVKVEYLTHRGTPVAYSVTILEGSKEGPKEVPKESPK
jgi:hypothetical protein